METEKPEELTDLVSRLNQLEDRIRRLQGRAATLRAEFAAALVDQTMEADDLFSDTLQPAATPQGMPAAKFSIHRPANTPAS